MDAVAEIFIRETDVRDLVSLLHLEQFCDFEISVFSGFVDAETDGINAACLEATVLYRKPVHEASQVGNNAVLEIENRVFANLAAPALIDPPEHENVSCFVRALAGNAHPDAPIRIRKIGQRPSRIFHPVHFFVHLTVEKLDVLQLVTWGEIHAVRPSFHYAEALVAFRRFSEQFWIQDFLSRVAHTLTFLYPYS